MNKRIMLALALLCSLSLFALLADQPKAQTKVEICDNGIDDDDDKLIDCADPDCDTSCKQEICDNGVDDDGDKLVDCADPDCDSSCKQEICDNGIDDDGDKLVDCADSDCKCGTPCSPGYWKNHQDEFHAICGQVPGWTCDELWTAITCRGSDASCKRQAAAAALNAVSGCTED